MLLSILYSAALIFSGLQFIAYFPGLLHRRKKLGRRGFAELIAHRGSRTEGLPENTIAAFKHAVDSGAEIVELDVWLSADGKLVVHHDDTFKRMTCGQNLKKIVEVEYQNIPSIVPPVGQKEALTAEHKHNDWQRIPLFEEVLDAVPETVDIIIEFKQNSDELIDKVHNMLLERNRRETVYWFSLIESINKKLRAKDNSIPTITSVVGMLKILMLYYSGLLPICSLDDAVFGITVDEITLEKIEHEPALKDAPGWLQKCLAFLFRGRPPAPMLAPGLFSQLRRRGVPVWFLGVNSEEDLRLAASSGATAFLTDRISWASNFVKTQKIQFKKI